MVTHHNTIIKFGYSDLSVLESLSESLNEAIRQLPITRQAGVAYRMNEVFIDVKDSSDILMNCNGAVLDRSSCNKVYVQAFLTGQPECKLVINDLEGILRQGSGITECQYCQTSEANQCYPSSLCRRKRLQDHTGDQIPPGRWITI